MEYLIFITLLFYIPGMVVYSAYLFRQKDFFQKLGFILMAIGFGFHTAEIGMKFIQTGYLPVRNLSETLFFAGWTVVLSFLSLKIRYRIKILGVYAAPLASLIVMASIVLPSETPLTKEFFNSLWLIFHVAFVFLGEAAFALAFGIGILYLLQEREIKSRKHRFFYRRLPSLELLDRTGYLCIAIGFVLMTVGLITGFIFAKTVWGKMFSGDPKEVWSIITWLLYAALLHERLIVGWRGRKAAIMSIIGFCVVLFTFFGVNFLMEGHHGVFTQ